MKKLLLLVLLLQYCLTGCQKQPLAEEYDYRKDEVGTYKVRVTGYEYYYGVTTNFDSLAELDFYEIKGEEFMSYADSTLRPVIRMKFHKYAPSTGDQTFETYRSGEIQWASQYNVTSYVGSFIAPDSIRIEYHEYGGGHHWAYSLLEGKRE